MVFEPDDLLRAGAGLCYDRSRSIEKGLAPWFETRHVAIYDSMSALLLPRQQSHAMSEVKTSRGWLVVDSVTPWLGLDTDMNPISARMLQTIGARSITWHEPIPDAIGILRGSYRYVIGLYGRHGCFYGPCGPLPDVNWGQLVENVSW